MSYKSKKAIIGVVLGSLIAGMSFQSTTFAAAADRGKKGVMGTATCGGTYYIGIKGTEIQRVNYIL